MSWKPLADRLSDLPLLLAGPILRQVTKDSVTVWVALKQPATVTLNVYDSDQAPFHTTLMTANRPSTAIGKNLHIVAVTARSPGKLSEGHIYFYDLLFASPPLTWTLSTAATPKGGTPVVNPFAYAPYALPSFALPPKDLNKLRLIHGSCRKPHGEGPDALSILDGLIAEFRDAPFDRPHQLLLTGDQIYADDVSDALLLLLTDAGDALMGWQESLPLANGAEIAKNLPPYLRFEPLKVTGFTSDDLRSHLMSLGEFFAMYLFAWSDVPWPDKTIPLSTFDEIFAISAAADQARREAGKAFIPVQGIIKDRKKTIEDDTKNTEAYRKTLPQIRQILANIPSYMICDDHEVTDDWNMTRRFCQDIYGSQLGMRVIQNGLLSFAVCQCWGNIPEQFDSDAQKNPPGLQLLQIMDKISALSKDQATGIYAANIVQLMNILGLHWDSELRAQTVGDYGPYHEAGFTLMINGVSLNTKSLRYNFSVEGDSHQVIVTDSRTWRTFPEKGIDTHPELIPGTALSSQLSLDIPSLNKRLLLMVFTTNIPTITSIRLLEDIATKDLMYEHDVYDGWSFPSVIFDRLIVRITKKIAQEGRADWPVVLLSGDVHFSYSTRLAYWAEREQLGDTPGQGTKTKLLFTQLIASALKNEIANTRGMQDVGYTYHPDWWQRWIMPPHEPEGYIGYNVTQRTVIGKGLDPDADDVVLVADPDHPTVNNSYFIPMYLSNTLNIFKPDYRYRLDFMTTSASGQVAPPPPSLSGNGGQAHAAASSAYVKLINSNAKNPDCIGHNNIGEIRFSVNATTGAVDHVFHLVRWLEFDANQNPVLSAATYDIPADIDNNKFKPIPADVELPR